MNRTKGILAAGTLTGLVLMTILALGSGNLRALIGAETAVPQQETDSATLPLPQTAGMSEEEALQAWQQYSAELEQTVRILQDREATYQTELGTANETILQLQNEINSANSAPAAYEYEDEDEEHEYETHEYNGHEYDEHEYGERDDD